MILKVDIQSILWLNFLSTYYVLNTFLNVLQVLTHYILTKSLSDKLYYDAYFTNNLKHRQLICDKIRIFIEVVKSMYLTTPLTMCRFLQRSVLWNISSPKLWKKKNRAYGLLVMTFSMLNDQKLFKVVFKLI